MSAPAEELLGRVADPVVEVRLAGDQDQLGELALAVVLDETIDQVAVEVVGVVAQSRRKVQNRDLGGGKDGCPPLGLSNRLDLPLAESAPPRRDGMR